MRSILPHPKATSHSLGQGPYNATTIGIKLRKKSIADDICVVNTFPTNDGGRGDKCQISISVSFSVAREAKISFPA